MSDATSATAKAGASAVVRNASAMMDIARGGQLDTDLTAMWLVLAASLVFFMQCGFALLEAGSVRLKNTKNILLKNVMNTCLGALIWWAIGYAFAHGECSPASNPVLGLAGFFSDDSDDGQGALYWSLWLFSWVFAAVSVTIPSGSLAERCQFRAYLLYTLWQSALIYPAVVHWVWSREGWLSPFRVTCGTQQPAVLFSRSMGVVDFAGSGNVHMTGGGAALVGAIMLGPRMGRFTDSGSIIYMRPNNPTSQVLGTFILWLGWYGFNPGSTGCMYGCMALASKVAVNTTLAAAAGGLTSLACEALLGHPGDIGPILNGILSGLVGITSPCAVVESYAAVLIGIISGLVMLGTSKLLKRCRIDDPLDSVPVHFASGIWGIISIGFFATKSGMAAAYPTTPLVDWGVFYGGNGTQLGVQILGAAAIAVFTLVLNTVGFGVLHWFGCLRVPKEVEEEGLDHSQSIGTGHIMGCMPCCAAP